ncbi:MFS transporter [Frankia sp. AgPm24]|uniref:MFS transporter n=1 Tax=Frankia sp. AgPm24 TaxID=631128 RepID=UPI00200BA2CB|nr:MFS transporter [Frankia sp. AgPm24]MCK9925321.1 MFS transporter [Frankia sp. AgPm24]
MTESAPQAQQRPGGRARRWLPLAMLCLGQMMIVIDQNIVNVALPVLQRSLHFSATSLVWVVNAYVIPFGGLLLFAGRLGDLIGRRSVFVAGVALFGATSLLCGLATSGTALIVFRFGQGIGGAVASACILGMVTAMFTEPREQAQGIAAYSFASAGGGTVGTLAGGVLTDLASWHWIFLVNVPIGAVVVVGALRTVKRDSGPGLARGVDLPGALLVTAGLMLAVHTIVHADQVGWGSVATLVLGPLAVVLLVAFVLREATAARPLLPLGIFRSRSVSAANAVQFLLIAGLFGLLYFGTLYLQRVLGYSPLQAGLAYVPIAVTIAVVSLGLAARLTMSIGPRVMLIGGLTLVVLGFVGLSFARADGTYVVDFLPASVLLGWGAGLAMPAAMGLGMSAVTPRDAGIASGLFNTSQQIGGAIGLTVLNAFVSTRTTSLVASGSTPRAAQLGGYHLAFLLAAAFAFAALVVAALVLRPRTDTHPASAAAPRPDGARAERAAPGEHLADA